MPKYNCNHCKDRYEVRGEPCQECCEHNSSGFDHDICIDCGYERDPGEAIDRAMDYFEDR